MNQMIKKISLASLVALAMFSCDDFVFGEAFLEQPLGGEMNIDSVYSKKIYVEQHLAQIYHTLPDFLSQNNRLSWGLVESLTDLGDNCKSGGTAYHSGTMSAANWAAGVYSMNPDPESGAQSAVFAFRQIGIFLANIDRLPDSEMSQEEKNIRKGEAKLIQAYHYVQIFRNMGGMPWIDKYYLPDDNMNMTRLTLEEMEQKICALIDEAAALLPWQVPAEESGRMTKAGALALKSRLLTFAASPLFNNDKPYKDGEAAQKHYTWYGNYKQERWRKALDAGLAFIRENEKQDYRYKLVDDKGSARKNFCSGYYDRYNGENLIEGHRFVKYEINGNAWNQLRYNVCCATLNYMEMFEMKDGSKFDWHNNPEHRAHPFFTETFKEVRDPRLYETLIVTGDKFWGRKAEIYKGGREQPKFQGGGQNWRWGNMGYTGMGIRKFFQDFLNEAQNRFYSMPLLRLPEVYLNIAEAMNELGIANQPDEFGRTAYDYINLVRARVEMPDMTPGDVENKYEGSLREAILHERAVEFGFEECRWYDIVRWKHIDYLDPLKNPIRRFSSQPVGKKVSGHYVNFTYTEYDKMVNQRLYVGEYWDDKFYLCPIPLEEINKKYGLVQNPGWE